jgi:hypothetical protein
MVPKSRQEGLRVLEGRAVLISLYLAHGANATKSKNRVWRAVMILKQKLIVGLLASGLWAVSMPTFAHHAFAAEFDANKPIALSGTLTKIEWINPHGWIYLDVKDKTTQAVTNWAVEFGGPNALMRRGLRKTDFPIGAVVNVNGYLAKSGKPVINGSTVKLPDGRDFFAGSENTGAPEPPKLLGN